MKIVNIAENEKFINNMISLFDDLECENISFEFYIIVKEYNNVFFDCNKTNKKIRFFNNEEELIDAVNKNNFDYCILHSIFFMNMHVLNKLKPKIIATTWGYDIYSDKAEPIIHINKLISMHLYKPLTKKLYGLESRPLKEKIDCYYQRFKYFITGAQHDYNKLVHKIKYISTILPNEYTIISNKLKKIKYFPFKYIVKNDTKKVFKENKILNNNILLGNSADPANNHLDILKILNENFLNYNVYIPLSYPNWEQHIFYKNKLKNYVKNNFKNINVIYLDNYIERSEYFKIIDNCSIAIYGYLNQAAIGNIFEMLRTGKKIFLYNDSIIYKYLKNYTSIFTIDNDLLNNEASSLLTYDNQLKNFNFTQTFENYTNNLNELKSFFLTLADDYKT